MSDQHRSLTIFAALAVLLVVFLLPFLPGTPKSRPSGSYLVESLAICFECHSDRDFSKPGWPIPPGRKGSGRILRGEGTPDLIVAPNISLSAPEVDAIVHYLRSIPPVHNTLPKMPNYIAGPNPPRVPMDSIQLAAHSNAIKRGQYLVRLAGCETCHTPRNAEGLIQGMEFAGGSIFRHANDEADAASNLTPDPTGIGSYTEQQFIAVIRTGRAGHRQINSAMPWYFYRNMTDSDLKAIFAYLKALPPISHKIDNTQPPSPCPKCRNPHGLGKLN